MGQITIEQAREAVRVRLGAVAKGINPKAERERQREEAERERAETALTFDALIEEWKALHLAHRRPRYAAEAERAICSGLPGLLKRPAARISRADAVNAIDKIVQGRQGGNRRPHDGLRARVLCLGQAARQGVGNPFARAADRGRRDRARARAER